MKTLCFNFIAASLLLLLPASLYACQQDEGTQNDAAGNTPDTPTDSAPAISAQEGTIEFFATRQRWMPELKSKVEELTRRVEASDSAVGLEEGVDATTQNAVVTELEEQIRMLQLKLNALRSGKPETSDVATKQPDKATLRKQIEQAFDVRQQLQQLEAQKLRLKLQMIESNLESRQKKRDRIIERRVEELLTTGIGDSSKSKKEHPAKSRIELLMFGVAYAEPFQKMKPIVKSMIEDGLPVRILDITTDKEQARRFKIDTIPTFVVTIDGQESKRFIGGQSEAELRREIRVSIRELESEAGRTSPVELPGPPRLPEGRTEAVVPFQKDSNPSSATGPANIQNTAAAMTWQQPTEIIRQLNNNLSATHVPNANLYSLKESISQSQKTLDDLISNGSSNADASIDQMKSELERLRFDLPGYQTRLDVKMREWRQTWAEYQTFVRLLRLDVEATHASLALLQQKIELRRRAPKDSFAPFEIQETESEVKLAEIQLRRAEELLQLYTDIEKNEPQLNPKYKAPPTDEATGVKSE